MIIGSVGVVGGEVMGAEVFDDVETAAVDVEVDVALLEVGGRRLPNGHLGVQLLDEAPGGIADALAVDSGVDKQQLQLAAIAIYAEDRPADYLAVEQYAVGFSIGSVDGSLDGGTRDDFAVLFEMVIAEAEFFSGTITERPLVVEDKLLAVGDRSGANCTTIGWLQGGLM